MTRFSKSTIIELVDALGLTTYNSITDFVRRFDIEEAINGGSTNNRNAAIKDYLIANPDKKGPFGAGLAFEIMEYLLHMQGVDSNLEQQFPHLVRSLKRDGYIIENLKLKSILPESLPIAGKEDELIKLLDKFEFYDTKTNYDNAVSAHARGEWESANSQLRTLFESLFYEIAKELTNERGENSSTLPPDYTNSKNVLTKLSPPFLLSRELNELNFLDGFFRRLHTQGAHPGQSEDEESTLRLHMLTLLACHYLRRFNARIG